ncbi:MAG: ester cyclase [Acidimicrobiia bacterium]|nr:ester cyclase [Acidimicrobiia bacterium]
MSGPDNLVRARRVMDELFNAGSLSAADELFAADVVDHGAPAGLQSRGRDGVKELVANLHVAFPDIRYLIEDEWAIDDLVIHRTRGRGTMRGEYLGFAPTGRGAEWAGIHILRFADGRITDHWGVADRLSMMQQLGVVPTPQA